MKLENIIYILHLDRNVNKYLWTIHFYDENLYWVEVQKQSTSV